MRTVAILPSQALGGNCFKVSADGPPGVIHKGNIVLFRLRRH
jgi:hypothetical protein